MQIELRILRFDPEKDSKPHLETYPVEAGPDGPRPGPAAQGQVRAGRHADVPPVVRPRRLRLGRDADQRAQPPRLQDPRGPAGRQEDHRGAAAGPAGDEGPRRGHGGLLRQVPERPAVPPERRRRLPERERRQSAADRARFDDTTKCILCAACTTSCPSFWAQPGYVGPAAIVNAHRFIFDSRDDAAEERLEILADRDGVWRCRTIFNCTDACPRGINITQAILEVSSAIVGRRA